MRIANEQYLIFNIQYSFDSMNQINEWVGAHGVNRTRDPQFTRLMLYH
jgi:hypothetical protein